MVLAPGANTALATSKASWTLSCGHPSAFGELAAVALLSVDEKRQPKGAPALFQTEQGWMKWSGDQQSVGCTLDLDALPAGSDRVLVIAYMFSAAGPVSDLRHLKLLVNDTIEHTVDLISSGESAIILGEFYQRNGGWKFRALAEGSAYGLAALGRRMGLEIDDAHPSRPANAPGSRRPGACTSATGTGFAVSAHAIVTCAHVIEGMNQIHINSFNGRYRVEPVVVDSRNDIALLRVESAAPPLVPVLFGAGSGCALGESVVAVGYPMSGFAGGGAHVTQGGVSALFGIHNDASLLQFTAPIQPGSSGSPLFDSSGAVVGLVTSTIPDAQNMNFALKASLMVSFLEACNIAVESRPVAASLSAADIARNVQPSLWKIEAQR